MHSTAGGTVRYRGIQWLPAPERPEVVGESLRAGSIEVVRDGFLIDALAVGAGDLLLVADGAAISPGARLTEPGWQTRVRAELPEGVEAVVHWSERPLLDRLDELTGLAGRTFDSTADAPIVLRLLDREGAVLHSSTVPRRAIVDAQHGAVVRRGALLAHVSLVSRDEAWLMDIVALRCVLDGARMDGCRAAKLSPVDGVVEFIDRVMHVRTMTGRLVAVGTPQHRRITVASGDRVRAGDTLVDGHRSHQQLLRYWGEARFAAHFMEEMELEQATRGIAIPRVYWSLLVRSLLAWRRVTVPGDTGFRRHQIVPRAEFERVQRETVARGRRPAEVKPALRGLRAIARDAAARRR